MNESIAKRQLLEYKLNLIPVSKSRAGGFEPPSSASFRGNLFQISSPVRQTFRLPSTLEVVYLRFCNWFDRCSISIPPPLSLAVMVKWILSSFFLPAEMVLSFSGNLVPLSNKFHIPSENLALSLFLVPYHYCLTNRGPTSKELFYLFPVSIKNEWMNWMKG